MGASVNAISRGAVRWAAASRRVVSLGLVLALGLVGTLGACADDGGDDSGGCEVGVEEQGHLFTALRTGDTAQAVYGTQGSLMIVLTLRSERFPIGESLPVRSVVDLRNGSPVMGASYRRLAKLDSTGVPHIDDLYVVLEFVGPQYVPDPERLIHLEVVVDTPSGPVSTTTDFKVEVEGIPYLRHPTSPR